MKHIESAGGIVRKNDQGETLVLLVERKYLDQGYIFPKGHVEPDETPQETAIREVGEETGFKNLLPIKKLGAVRRRSTETTLEIVEKTIHLYLFDVTHQEQQESELPCRWFNLAEAQEALIYIEEKAFFAEHISEITSL